MEKIFEYNTERKNLILKEYGRNIQKLVLYLKTIENREKRSQAAATLIELMKQISPSIRENNETNQKLWDDLFIMSGFDLDIDSPYPMPPSDILNKKPLRLNYSSNNIRFKHYGKNIELLIKKAIEIDDPEEKEAAVIYIGKLMKSFYSTWNKDNIEEDSILKNIKELSKNLLDIDIQKVKENNLFESLYKERPKQTQYSGGKGRKNQRGGKRRR